MIRWNREATMIGLDDDTNLITRIDAVGQHDARDSLSFTPLTIASNLTDGQMHFGANLLHTASDRKEPRDFVASDPAAIAITYVPYRK